MKTFKATIWPLLPALLLSLAACRRHGERLTFTHEVLLPMTPVKDQGHTQLCWAYAMLATIETEHLLRGDSVNLSPQYIGRMLPDYQKPFLTAHNSPRGDAAADRGPDRHATLPSLRSPTQRALCQTLLNMLDRYGVVGYDVMPDDAPPTLTPPRHVFMLGARYTPTEFAHSVCAPGEYVGLTTIADSPYYRKIDVPIPDNWEHNRLLNMPKNELRRLVNRTLRSRHPVCWESRDHAMAIVGMARDQHGRAYYVLKNSWGADRPYGGLVYMPPRQLWRDVAAVYLPLPPFSVAPPSSPPEK
mgnify:CR=1 FL=1